VFDCADIANRFRQSQKEENKRELEPAQVARHPTQDESSNVQKTSTSSFIEITQAAINAVRKGGLPPLNPPYSER
jgi:hypothetical protein